MCTSNFLRSQYNYYHPATNTSYYSQVLSKYHIHTRTLHCMYMSKVFFLPQRLHSLHLYSQDMADKCYNHLQTTLFRRYISRECLSNHMIKMYTVHILRYRVNELQFNINKLLRNVYNEIDTYTTPSIRQNTALAADRLSTQWAFPTFMTYALHCSNASPSSCITAYKWHTLSAVWTSPACMTAFEVRKVVVCNYNCLCYSNIYTMDHVSDCLHSFFVFTCMCQAYRKILSYGHIPPCKQLLTNKNLK